MSPANDLFVRLKNPSDLLQGTWKITSRFVVHIGPEEWIHCIRLRLGAGPVMHFTLSEYKRLFRPLREGEK
jgi:hypothetical protein